MKPYDIFKQTLINKSYENANHFIIAFHFSIRLHTNEAAFSKTGAGNGYLFRG